MTENRRKLGIPVVGEVAARFVHFDPADLGGVDRLITSPNQLSLDKFFENAADRGPLGQPEAQPLSDVITDVEQAMLFTEDAVIASRK